MGNIFQDEKIISTRYIIYNFVHTNVGDRYVTNTKCYIDWDNEIDKARIKNNFFDRYPLKEDYKEIAEEIIDETIMMVARNEFGYIEK